MVRSTIILACLSIFLLLPFALRHGVLPTKPEPYPAVLFPLGDMKIELGRQVINSRRLELFSIDRDGTEHRLPPAEFLHPVPVHYFASMAGESKKFGLASNDKKVSFGSGSWQLTAKKSPSTTSQQKREVTKWLAARLRAVDRPLDRTITVRSTIVQIDTTTGDEISAETNFQYAINLDDHLAKRSPCGRRSCKSTLPLAVNSTLK